MRRIRQLLAAYGAVALVFAGSTAIQAHMKIVKTEPAANAVVSAPTSNIQIVFSEAPDLKVSKIEIKGPSTTTKLAPPQVTEKSLAAAIQGDMPDGVYTVSWQAAGPDGHVQKGDFTFTVKRK